MRKGAGECRTLFLLYNSIISIPTCLTANFSDFIFLANSMAYAENRPIRGLTRFSQKATKGAPKTWREERARRWIRALGCFTRSVGVYLRRMAACGRTAGRTNNMCDCAAADPDALCAANVPTATWATLPSSANESTSIKTTVELSTT